MIIRYLDRYESARCCYSFAALRSDNEVVVWGSHHQHVEDVAAIKSGQRRFVVIHTDGCTSQVPDPERPEGVDSIRTPCRHLELRWTAQLRPRIHRRLRSMSRFRARSRQVTPDVFTSCRAAIRPLLVRQAGRSQEVQQRLME